MREFRTSRGRFILGDARELIKEVPASSVDVIITDPPWGMGMDEYDDIQAFRDLVGDMHRVLKRDAWCILYAQPRVLPEAFRIMEGYFDYVWMLIRLFFRTYSKSVVGDVAYAPILVFAKGKPKVHYRRVDVLPSDELPLIQIKVREPLFKPTMTTATLLQMFTRPGDLVLDPFAGYGSIPLTCDVFGRRWLAFEIDPVKFEIARKFIVERTPVDIKATKRKMKSEKKKNISLVSYIFRGQEHDPYASQEAVGLSR